MQYARKRYRSPRGGQAIPQVKSKFDIFNGHMENPGEFIVIYSILTAFFVGMLIFALTFLRPLNAANPLHRAVTLVSVETTEEGYILSDGSETVYKFNHPFRDPQALSALSESGHTVDLYGKEATPDDEPAYFSVCTIYRDGKAVYSFAEYNAQNRRDAVPVIAVLGSILCLWVCFAILSVIVGRNPSKFPRRFVFAFFKPGYVIFD